MNRIYTAPEYGNQGDMSGNVCPASDVTAVATDVEGPETCEIGSKVKVNVTARLEFSNTRYNIGVYTFTGTPDGLGFDSNSKAAVFGDECAFDRPTETFLVSTNPAIGIQDIDKIDSCLDAGVSSNETGGGSGAFTYEGFKFQKNLEIPCATEYGESLLALQACFTWRTL